MTKPPKESVVTANGEGVPITGADSLALTLTLSLHRTALILTLLNHLLSVGQVIEQFGYIVLMFLTFYLLKDI